MMGGVMNDEGRLKDWALDEACKAVLWPAQAEDGLIITVEISDAPSQMIPRRLQNNRIDDSEGGERAYWLN